MNKEKELWALVLHEDLAWLGQGISHEEKIEVITIKTMKYDQLWLDNLDKLIDKGAKLSVCWLNKTSFVNFRQNGLNDKELAELVDFNAHNYLEINAEVDIETAYSLGRDPFIEDKNEDKSVFLVGMEKQACLDVVHWGNFLKADIQAINYWPSPLPYFYAEKNNIAFVIINGEYADLYCLSGDVVFKYTSIILDFILISDILEDWQNQIYLKEQKGLRGVKVLWLHEAERVDCPVDSLYNWQALEENFGRLEISSKIDLSKLDLTAVDLDNAFIVGIVGLLVKNYD